MLRDGRWQWLPSTQLVPGDVVAVVGAVELFPADAVLIGGSCLVKEAMLTGEAVPQPKEPVSADAEELLTEEHRVHVVFSGTEVVYHRNEDRKAPPGQAPVAVVIRTGFSTTKGRLLQTIFSNRPRIESKEQKHFR